MLGEAKSNQVVHSVVVVGAGFSGICAGVKLREKGITDFVILEKNQGVGGTWWDNRYPGSQCDVPSHLYCYSFEMNPNWSRRFAPQAEIQQYLANVVEKYSLTQHLINGIEVKRYTFDDEAKLWNVHLADGSILKAHHVISGTGALNVPSYPNIPGRDSFEGISMHTMSWDSEFDYDNRRIVMIGSAASAIQIVPHVAETAEHLTLFQRSANYIAPRYDPAYSKSAQALRKRFPWLMHLERGLYWLLLETVFYSATRKRSLLRNMLSKFIVGKMNETVKDIETRKALTPDHKLGCKRPLMSNNFYQSFNCDNVQLETTGIAAIEPKGIRDRDGKLHECDTIVYATGFDLGAGLALDVTGPNGLKLKDQWAEYASAYKGNSVPNMPNFHLVTGPNIALGNMSFVYVIESQINYIMKCVEQSGKTHLMQVKEHVNNKYNDMIHSALSKETIWFDGCNNWFLNDAGRSEVNYPWRAFNMRKKLNIFNIDDYELISK